MELLPNDLQLIVHRYVVGSAYRNVIDQYNNTVSVGTGIEVIVYYPPQGVRHAYNWRHLASSYYTEWSFLYISTIGGLAITPLSPNYIRAQLITND